MMLEVNRAKLKVIIKDQKHFNSDLTLIDNTVLTSMGWPEVSYNDSGRMYAIFCWNEYDRSRNWMPLRFKTHDDLKLGLYYLQEYALNHLHEPFEIFEIKEGRTLLC